MKLLSIGYNKSCLLCRHGKNKIPLPVDILPNMDKIKCLSLGFLKGLAVYVDGSVLGWGGSLSEKNPNKDEIPYQISGLSNIVSAKSGYLFDIFLDKDGKVFYLAKLSPSVQQIQIDEPITNIFGYELAYVVGKSGNLYSIQNVSQTAEKIDFESNFIDFDKNDRIQNVITYNSSTIILTKSKKVFGKGAVVSNSQKFIEIENLKGKNIIKIDSMMNSMLALSEEGDVYVNGSNSSSKIGLANVKKTEPTEFTKLEFSEKVRIIDLASSHSFSLFLDESGTVWSTGTSTDGCLLRGSDEIISRVPEKATLLNEKVTSIFCGSCFCYLQIGGVPLSKCYIKKPSIEKNKKPLSLVGIESFLSFSNSNEFHFLFDDHVVSMNRLFADFISPKVAQLHFIDPTIDSFVISNKNDREQIDAFEKIIKIAKGEVIKFDLDELPLLAKLSQILSNDELFNSVFDKFNSDLSMWNVFSVIEFEIIHFKCLSEKSKKFLAENFYQILKNHRNKLDNLKLDDEIIFDILSDDNLVIEDEDSLYLYVASLIKDDKSNAFLLECVEFGLLSNFYVKNFINSFDTDDITGVLWKQFVKLLNPFTQQVMFYDRYAKNSINTS